MKAKQHVWCTQWYKLKLSIKNLWARIMRELGEMTVWVLVCIKTWIKTMLFDIEARSWYNKIRINLIKRPINLIKKKWIIKFFISFVFKFKIERKKTLKGSNTYTYTYTYIQYIHVQIQHSREFDLKIKIQHEIQFNGLRIGFLSSVLGSVVG